MAYPRVETRAVPGDPSGNIGLRRLKNTEVDRLPLGTINKLMEVTGQHLKPGASEWDKLAYIYFPVMDILNPLYHRETSIEFVEVDGKEVGFDFIWKGHKYNRHHIYLLPQDARQYITYLQQLTPKRPIALAVVMRDDTALTRDGFETEEICSPSNNWKAKCSAKTGRLIETYAKMYLTRKDLEDAKSQPGLLIPELDGFSDLYKIPSPEQLSPKLANISGNVSIRRLYPVDFFIAEQLHKENNPHSSIKPAELVSPNYGIFIDDELIAMGGYSSDAVLRLNERNYHLFVAANLVVNERFRGCGLGSRLSYTLKKLVFQAYPEAIIFADNVPGIERLWIKGYNAHKVCTSGWVVYINRSLDA